MRQIPFFLIQLVLFFSTASASDEHLLTLGSTTGGEYKKEFYSLELRFNTVGIYMGVLPDSTMPVDNLYGTSSTNITLDTSRSHITDPLALGLVKYFQMPSGEISIGASVHKYETCDIVTLNSTSMTYCNNHSNDTDIALMLGYSLEITRGFSLGVEYSTVSGTGIRVSLF